MLLQYVSGADSLLEVIFLPFTAVPFVEGDIVTDSVYALPGSAFLFITEVEPPSRYAFAIFTFPVPSTALPPLSPCPRPATAINVPAPEIVPLSRITAAPPTEVVAMFPPPYAASWLPSPIVSVPLLTFKAGCPL